MLALAIVYAAVVLFAGYGSLGLTEPDEGRYAEVAREMMQRLTQDGTAWLYPTLDGEPYYNKPPLVFWLTVAGLKLFGINEWGARMPGALAAFGTVLMVVWLMRRWGGDRLATLAAIVLPTTSMFFIIGRLITTDMSLTFFITTALVAFAVWLESGKRRPLVVFWLALAGGMMTKGPVGVVVPLLVVIATLLWLRQPCRLLALGWAWGLPLFAVVALPWFIVVATHFDLWNFFIGRETVGRFFTSIHKRSQPFWFFFAVLPAGLLPWTPLALLGAATAPPEGLSQDWKQRRALLVSWVLVPLVFFSASHSKLHTYILPACVPAALLVAHLWNTLLAEPKQMTSKRWTRAGLRATWLFTALMPLAMWAWLAHGLKPDGTLPLVVGLCAAATTAVVLLAGAWAWRDPARWFAALAACLPLILVGGDYAVAMHEEALGSRASFHVIGTALRKMAQKEDLVVLATMHIEHYGLSFYANRLVTKRHYGDPPKGIHVLPATELGLAEPDIGHIWGWVMEGHRIFFVASHAKLNRLLKTAPVPLQQLLVTHEYVLLSNR